MSTRMIEEGKDPVRILIVDDDVDIGDVLLDLISQEGRIVEVCYDGLAAVRRIQKSPYDLLVLDLVMPGLEGLEVFRYAKKINPDVVVIIITGYASLETAIAAIKEGAYDFIQKPFKLEGFKITVDNAVEKIRLNKENRDLLAKLQTAYKELTALKEKSASSGRIASINFLPSGMPSLHYLYGERRDEASILEKLNALVSLKEKGLLTDREFRAMKGHVLNAIEKDG